MPAEAGAAGHDRPPPVSTYHQHVAPILQAKCVTCHAPGGIAPFALDTPAAAQTYAGLMKAATQRGRHAALATRVRAGRRCCTSAA